MIDKKILRQVITVLAIVVGGAATSAPACAGLIFDIHLGAEGDDGSVGQAPGGWISLPDLSGDRATGVSLIVDVDPGFDLGAPVFDPIFDESQIFSIEWLVSSDLIQLELLNLELFESVDCDLNIYPSCSSHGAGIYIADGAGTWEYGGSICDPEDLYRCSVVSLIADNLVARTTPAELPANPTAMLMALGLALLLRTTGRRHRSFKPGTL